MTWMETGYVGLAVLFGVISLLVVAKRNRDLAQQRKKLIGKPLNYSLLPDGEYKSYGGCGGNGFLSRAGEVLPLAGDLIAVVYWPGSQFPPFGDVIEKIEVTEVRVTTISGTMSKVPPRERAAS
ncbi:MAG: hypothetical protein Q7S57_06095 [bacterium]|nr:hypothetical protein [bacterium]